MEQHQVNWVYIGDLDESTFALLDQALGDYSVGEFRGMLALAGTALRVAMSTRNNTDAAISSIFVGVAHSKLESHDRAAAAFNTAQMLLSRDPSWRQRVNEVVALYGLGMANMRREKPSLVNALARWQKGLAIIKGVRFYYVVDGLNGGLDVVDEIAAELLARIQSETRSPMLEGQVVRRALSARVK